MSDRASAHPHISIYPTGSENWHSSGWEQPSMGAKKEPVVQPAASHPLQTLFDKRKQLKEKTINWWGTMTELQLRGFIVATSLIAGISLLGVLGQYWIQQNPRTLIQNDTEVADTSSITHLATTTITSTVTVDSRNTSESISADSSPSIPISHARDTVNINTATEQELQALPGVGPATAASIVNFRQTHGPFHTLDELVAVDGIGEGKLTKLRNHATV